MYFRTPSSEGSLGKDLSILATRGGVKNSLIFLASPATTMWQQMLSVSQTNAVHKAEPSSDFFPQA